MRRGQVDVGASLDLHGETFDSAAHKVRSFLIAAHNRGDRTVIIVTGKGRGGDGVLKRALPDWLADPSLKSVLSGYAQAHRTHGGAGAYYVFLKAKRES